LSDALGAAALDIDAILCMSGNHQSLGVCPQAAAANDLDSVQFTQAMKKLVIHGLGLNGKSLEPRLEFQVGATAHPYLRPLELSLLRLKKKIWQGRIFCSRRQFSILKGYGWMNGVRTAVSTNGRDLASVLPLAALKARNCGPDLQAGAKVFCRMGRSAQPAREGAKSLEMVRLKKCQFAASTSQRQE
jgi:methylenetetrahydrofolate reductase (NADPH)